MSSEEKEFNEFMKDVSEKAMDLHAKYNKLSENNKRSFLAYIEPLVRASGIQAFVNEVNNLFPK
ncbi:MAG: hypothetical protein J5710_01170 [Treponema sp.]|nr:hypothetical protein [Treponema sp.]